VNNQLPSIPTATDKIARDGRDCKGKQGYELEMAGRLHLDLVAGAEEMHDMADRTLVSLLASQR
jgi:hypothetical protein